MAMTQNQLYDVQQIRQDALKDYIDDSKISRRTCNVFEYNLACIDRPDNIETWIRSQFYKP
jgi:hypothetical protein